MSKYRRNGRWTIRVPDPDTGKFIEKASGTQSAALAGHYETMCDVLLGKHADHVFLRAVIRGRIKLRRLYTYWSAGTLGELRDDLVDTDLTPYLKDWRAQLVTEHGEPEGKPGCSSHTVTQYTKQVAAFFTHAGGATLSNYTVEKASRWLHSRPVSSARKRRYWAALRSCGHYLQSVGLLPADRVPLAALKAPKAGKARDKHLSEEDRDRLIAATAGVECRAAEAMAHLGMEQGAIIQAKVRDVKWNKPGARTAGTIRMRGTKNRFRDRVGVVEWWAEPFIRAAMQDKHPEARIVPWGHNKIGYEHRAACKAIGLTGYRLHDARHTFAKLWWDQGAPSSVIGLQLGHADGREVEKTYGRGRTTLQQLEHWAGVVAGETKETKAREAK